MFVDEAHAFKNLSLQTKMGNLAGLNTGSSAKRAEDMHMKCRYMNEKTDSKGVIFATGTPVSNTMAELYTMQRYLQPDELKHRGLQAFDAWAAQFGKITAESELAPEGTGYRVRQRFAKFKNLPELMKTFKETADIKTAETLDHERPKANRHTVVIEPSEHQVQMMKGLAKRAEDFRTGKCKDPAEMLLITAAGRRLGLDQRLLMPGLPDHDGSKVNTAVANIHKIWQETEEKSLTQLVFLDFSTPKPDAKPKPQNMESEDEEDEGNEQALDYNSIGEKGNFTVYQDMKDKLVAKGILEHEIAFIHDAKNDNQKQQIFDNVKSGKIRVLFGSTEKMGAGTNVQDKLIALHHMDCPWKPAEIEQREGRIERQGNTNPEVDIFKYVTKGTFDAYLFQTIQKKQEYISQIMTSKEPVRSADDIDAKALSYSEVKALCAGDPRLAELMNLENEVKTLKVLRSAHTSEQHTLEKLINVKLPTDIKTTQEYIAGHKEDQSRAAKNTKYPKQGISPMVIKGKTYTDRKEAGQALREEAFKTTVGTQCVGTYRGFDIHVRFNPVAREYDILLKGALTHTVEMGADASGNITRLNNALDNIGEKAISNLEDKLASLAAQLENAKGQMGKPFPREQEYQEKNARHSQLETELRVDTQSPEDGHDTHPAEPNIDAVQDKHTSIFQPQKDKSPKKQDESR